MIFTSADFLIPVFLFRRPSPSSVLVLMFWISLVSPRASVCVCVIGNNERLVTNQHGSQSLMYSV